MAATLFGEVPERELTSTADSKERKRVFLVRTSAKTEYGEDVMLAPGVPQYGDIHPRNAAMVARRFKPKQDRRAWWKWTLEVGYVVPDQQEDPEDNPDDNPLLRDAEITYSTESITIASRGEVDASGNITKAIVNSAGEPYDPTPEEEIQVLLVTYRRWEVPNFSVSLFYSFQNAVNDGNFAIGDLTIGEGFAKVIMLVGKTERHLDPDDVETKYREFEYRIMVNPLGWDLEVLDWGTFYFESNEKKLFVDEQNQEFGLLDGSGGRLTGDPPAPGTEVYNKWKNKERKDFSLLNLPAGP